MPRSRDALEKSEREVIWTRIDLLNQTAFELIDVDRVRALELVDLSHQLSLEHQYKVGAARSKFNQAMLDIARGFTEEAVSKLEKSLVMFQLAGDFSGVVDSQEALGRLHLENGSISAAEEVLRSALSISGSSGYLASKARILNLIGRVHHQSGAYAKCIHVLEEALSIIRKLGNNSEEANLLCNIGLLQVSIGDYPHALHNLSQSYGILSSKTSNERTKGIVAINLAHLYSNMGEFFKVVEYSNEALRIAVNKDDNFMESTAILNIGMAQERMGQNQEAEQSFRRALDLSRTIQYRQGELSALDGLGSLLAKRGQYQEAAEAHAEAVTIAQEIEDLEGELDALLHLGQVQAELGDLPAALASLERALTLAQEADHKKTVYETHRALSAVHKRAGDFERALHHHEQYHEAERALFNEEGDKKTRELTAQFDVERARHETEVQRLQREVAETAREQAEALVRERTHELEQAQVEIVTRLAVAAEYRDDLTGEHTWRVGHVSALIAQELGLPQEDVALLRIAARLHDVGKIGIPDSILLKPGRFTPEEFERMKAHTLIGARILSGGHSRLLRMAEEIALSHHERWDGGGYPLGRAGQSIPITGRIVSVADVFDALTNERPYKQAWPPEEALAELRRHAGIQFDPEVVEAGLRVFMRPDFARVMTGEVEQPVSATAR